MAERHMSDKQCNCIAWICNTLGIEYNGTMSSYDAWKFISENKHLLIRKWKTLKQTKRLSFKKTRNGLQTHSSYMQWQLSDIQNIPAHGMQEAENFQMSSMGLILMMISSTLSVRMASAVLMILKNSDGCLLSMTIHCCNNAITYNERKY